MPGGRNGAVSDNAKTPAAVFGMATDVATLTAQQGSGRYHEFLMVPALSLGLFSAAHGHVDAQDPHDQDEVYAIVSGGRNSTLPASGTRSQLDRSPMYRPVCRTGLLR